MATLAEANGFFEGYDLPSYNYELAHMAAVAPVGAMAFPYENLAMDVLGSGLMDSIVSSFGNTPVSGVFRVDLAISQSGQTAARSLHDIAAGANDANYLANARSLQTFTTNTGRTQLIRPGWEYEGGWYDWSVNNEAGTQTATKNIPDYCAAFRRVVNIYKSQCPSVVVTLGGSCYYGGGPNQVGSHSTSLWRQVLDTIGDIVDVFGVDIYNDDLGRGSSAANTLLIAELNTIGDLALAYGKKIGIHEWGFTGAGASVIDPVLFVNTIYNFLTDPKYAASVSDHEIFDVFDPQNNGNRGFRQVSAAGAAEFKRLFTQSNVIVVPPAAHIAREWIGIVPEGVGTTAPATPTNVLVSGGNGAVTVAWTNGANGGSPITGATITPYIGATAQTTVAVTGAAQGQTVTATNGTTYTYTVISTNAVGSSAASAASAAVTPSAGWSPNQAPVTAVNFATTVAASFTTTPSSTRVIVFVQGDSGVASTGTLAGAGGTWTRRGISDDGGDAWSQTWEGTGLTGAGPITYTHATTSALDIELHDGTGIGTFDQTATGTAAFGTKTLGSGTTGTLAHASSIAFANFVLNQGQTDPVFNNSFVTLDSPADATGFGTNGLFWTGYKTVSSTAALTTTLTWFVTPDNGIGHICVWAIA